MQDKLKLFLKGIWMGIADIIPGVSGGTIALITGIYVKLIQSLSSISLKHIIDLIYILNPFLRKEKRGSRLQNLREIQWIFLITLGSGILLGILAASKVIFFILLHYPFQCYCFFFGLILISLSVPYKETEKNINAFTIILVFASLVFILLKFSTQIEGSESLFYIFFSGTLSISAMILPGISGAYVLAILGQYQLIIEALNHLDFQIISIFVAGIIVGIFSFLRLLRFLMEKYYTRTMAALTGIMLGSLVKIWPLDHLKDASNYEYISGFILMLLGMFILFSLQKTSNRLETKLAL